MSWSVSGSGTPAEVRGQLSAQFKWPLSNELGAGLSDAGERESVQKVSDLLEQVLATYDPARHVTVSAYGHMGFQDWEAKTGAYQNVVINIADAGMPPPVAEAVEEKHAQDGTEEVPEAAIDAPSISVDVPAVDAAPDAAEAPADAITDGPTENT